MTRWRRRAESAWRPFLIASVAGVVCVMRVPRWRVKAGWGGGHAEVHRAVLADHGDGFVDMGALGGGQAGEVAVDPVDEPADAGDLLLGWGGVGVDLGDHALGAVVVGLQAGFLGLAGGAEAAEEPLGRGGLSGPDVAVAGVVGGLGAAGRITEACEWLTGVWGAGEFEAQRTGGVGEPAVVRDAQVQGSRALGQQVEHVPAGALDFRSRRGVAGVELAVDAGEELDELAGAGASGQDAVLVVAELGEDQVQVALLFVFADLG